MIVSAWLPEMAWGDWTVKRVGANTELRQHDRCWMSDLPQDTHEEMAFAEIAYGSVLIAGLGMGFLPWLLGQDKAVDRIDVLEIDASLIAHIGPHLAKASPLVSIFHASALEFTPETVYDLGWFDFTEKPMGDRGKAIVRERYAGSVRSIRFWTGA